jgi:hypothetical protein
MGPIIIGFLITALLAAIGWLRFTMIAVFFLLMECTIWYILEKHYYLDVGRTGIITNYISVDVVIVLFFIKLGKDIYLKSKK